MDTGPRQSGTEGAATVPLWRNARFQLLWTGGAASLLMTEVHAIAIPLLMLRLTGSSALAGTFGATQLAAAVALGIPAGSLVDRHNRWTVLVAAEVVRLVTVSGVLLGSLTDRLSAPLLIVAAAVMGTCTPFVGGARMVMIRRIVPQEQLRNALTQDEIRGHAVSLTGPSLGGFLASLSRSVPFMLTAALSLFSVVCALLVGRSSGRIHKEAIDAEADKPMGRLHGLRVLWRDPVLRFGTLFATTSNFALAPLVLVVVVGLRRQDVSSTVIGVTTAALVAGGLVGTLLVTPLQSRLSPGRLLLVVGGCHSGPRRCLAVFTGPVGVAVLLALIGLLGPVVRILIYILIFQQVPDAYRGRTVTSFMTVTGAGSAVRLLASGLLLERHPAIAVALLAVVLGAVVLAGSSNAGVRAAEWPAPRSD